MDKNENDKVIALSYLNLLTNDFFVHMLVLRLLNQSVESSLDGDDVIQAKRIMLKRVLTDILVTVKKYEHIGLKELEIDCLMSLADLVPSELLKDVLGQSLKIAKF